MPIREEKLSDYLEIQKLNDLAFGQEDEGILINELRANPDYISALSLVAEINDTIVGHILFTPIKIVGQQSHSSLALAPMSVLPKFQRQGWGSKLVNAGLKKVNQLNFTSVIVLGHLEFYHKFGFKPASLWNITAAFSVPDEVFMAIELESNALKNISGIVQYLDAFQKLS